MENKALSSRKEEIKGKTLEEIEEEIAREYTLEHDRALRKCQKKVLKLNQFERIVRKFGGAVRLAKMINEVFPDENLTHYDVLAWQSRENYGQVPHRYMHLILHMSRIQGVRLTVEDCFPGIL